VQVAVPAAAGPSTVTSIRRGRQRSGPFAQRRSQTASSAAGPRFAKSIVSVPVSVPPPRGE
jgi:hypothetical protein